MFSSRCVPLALLALLLAACASVDPVTGSYDRSLGEAVAWNKQAQVVNPDPVLGNQGAQPGDRGDRAARADQRYRTDRVKPVERVGTTEGGGGSGGGGTGPR